MKLEIKNLNTSRWKEFKELRLNALINEPTAFGRSYEYEKSFKSEEWIRILKTKGYLFAFVDDKVVGMIGYNYSNMKKVKHIADIIGVYVEKDFRNLKLGYKLFKEILKKIKSENFKKIKVGVNTKQIPALKLYQKFGFNIVAKFEKELKVNNSYYDEFVLEKIL